MADSNLTHARRDEANPIDKRYFRRVAQNLRFVRNKDAFDEIFGDPFAKPDPLQGRYQALKARSSIPIVSVHSDEGKVTRNNAQPSSIDFFCDAEKVISIALPDAGHFQRFIETYLHETGVAFIPEERTALEQRIGKLLLAYGISPISRYFTSIRTRKLAEPRATGHESTRSH